MRYLVIQKENSAPELRDEIQSDWNEYQAWEKRRQELLGR